jgi:septum formation protein
LCHRLAGRAFAVAADPPLLAGAAQDRRGLRTGRGCANAILFEIVCVARLSCRRLSPAFITAFMAQGNDALLASAGAYQLEGLGIHLFEAIEGNHATILGLPLLPLLKFLREEGSLLS